MHTQVDKVRLGQAYPLIDVNDVLIFLKVKESVRVVLCSHLICVWLYVGLVLMAWALLLPALQSCLCCCWCHLSRPFCSFGASIVKLDNVHWTRMGTRRWWSVDCCGRFVRDSRRVADVRGGTYRLWRPQFAT